MSGGFSLDMTQPFMREKVALTVGKSRLLLELKLGDTKSQQSRFTVSSMKHWLGLPAKKRMKRQTLIEMIEARLLEISETEAFLTARS